MELSIYAMIMSSVKAASSERDPRLPRSNLPESQGLQILLMSVHIEILDTVHLPIGQSNSSRQHRCS